MELKIKPVTCVSCLYPYVRTQGIGQEICLSCYRKEYSLWMREHREELEGLSKKPLRIYGPQLGYSSYATLYDDLPDFCF